jgi:hypothetical protein
VLQQQACTLVLYEISGAICVETNDRKTRGKGLKNNLTKCFRIRRKSMSRTVISLFESKYKEPTQTHRRWHIIEPGALRTSAP